ncbi:MAG TPA: leucyl/phenylalanyl-tRNA--protein transferase [Mycobacteriales bacterium]|nr:leucyl/phenylalanyl-tRNA--protein transferase [Mycobacteriales bacterium]
MPDEVRPAAFFEQLDVVAAPRELVALGGTLDPATLVAAYRAGCFPWPPSGPATGALQRSAKRLARTGRVPVLEGCDGLVPWCSPEPRAVLLPDLLTVSRSLRRRLRSCGWETTVDTAFPDVMAGCADRDETWINERMRAAYTALHAEGGAHSLEVWDGERLVGGLYGVLTGGVFSGESMFHRESDASKVALVDLVHRLREGGVVLLDTQQQTAHMASLGQVAVRREEYVAALRQLRDLPAGLPTGRRPVARLV